MSHIFFVKSINPGAYAIVVGPAVTTQRGRVNARTSTIHEWIVIYQFSVITIRSEAKAAGGFFSKRGKNPSAVEYAGDFEKG